VKSSEASCPFCDAAVTRADTAALRAPVSRDRAAMLFGAATLASALGVAACNAGPPAPAYGGPPPLDTHAVTVTTTDPPAHPPVAAYGAPMPTGDAAPALPPAPTDAGAPKPKK
jgi:hypothetical protein